MATIDAAQMEAMMTRILQASASQAAADAAATRASRGPQQQKVEYKVRFKSFTGDPGDWRSWSNQHKVLVRSLDCDNALDVPEGEEIYVGRTDFDGSGLDPEKVRQAETAWRSLIDNCSGMAFDIVEDSESVSVVWKRLNQKYQPSSVGEIRRLKRAIFDMSMEPGEDPVAFIIRVGRAQSELRDLKVIIDDDTIKVQIVTGLSNEYDNERRMLDSKSREKLTMEKIRTITAQRYDRLQQEKGDAGGIALAAMSAAATSGTPRCQLCEKLGHTAKVCRSSGNNSNSNNNNKELGGGAGGNKGGRQRGRRNNIDFDRIKNKECFGCGKKGHFKANCPEKSNGGTGGAAGSTSIGAMMAISSTDATTKQEEGDLDVWVLDTGATDHITSEKTSMTKFVEARNPSTIVIADGTSIEVTGYGELIIDMKQPGGGDKKLTLSKVALVPGAACNLLSAKRACENSGKSISLDKGS